MAILPICYYGNPTLKKKASDVEDISAIQALIDDMFETMYENKGVGLAAVQVGKALNLFVLNAAADDEKAPKSKEEIFINPKILKYYGNNCDIEEGCLSVPELREKVKRKAIIDIEYINRHGKKCQEIAVDGMRARIIQHETDHLNGILFVDRLSPTKKIFIKKELRNIMKENS